MSEEEKEKNFKLFKKIFSKEYFVLEREIKRICLRWPLVKMVILFGSIAQGKFSEDSDYDLLFVLENIKDKKIEMIKKDILNTLLDAELDRFPNVLVWSEGKLMNPFLLKNALREGVTLWSQ